MRTYTRLLVALIGALMMALLLVMQAPGWSSAMALDATLRPDRAQAIFAPELADELVYRWTSAATTLHAPPATSLLHVRLRSARPVTLTLALAGDVAVPVTPVERTATLFMPRQRDVVLRSPTFEAPGDGRALGVVLSGLAFAGRWDSALTLPTLLLALLPGLLSLLATRGRTQLALLLLSGALLLLLQRSAAAWLLADGAAVLATLGALALALRHGGWRAMGGGLLALGVVSAGLLPAPAAWGIQAVLHLPEWLRLLLPAALLLLGLLPWRWPGSLRLRSRGLWVLGWAIAGAALALLLPVEQLGGDGATIEGYIASGMHVHWKQPLDFWLHAALYDLTAPLGWAPRQVYVVWDALAAAAYAAAAALCAWDWAAAPWQRWLTQAALLGTGLLILFAGYVESYALVTAALLAYAWAAWRTLMSTGPAWLAGAMLGLAVVLHPLALWAAPSLLLLGQRGRRSLLHALAGAAAVVGGVVLAFSLAGAGPWTIGQHKDAPGGYDGGLFVPLRAANGLTERYTLWQATHWLAWLNGLLVAAPGALAVLAWRWRRTPFERWLLVLLSGALLWAFVWNPDLGARQDWDLLGVAGVPLVLATGWQASHLTRASLRAGGLAQVLLPWLLVVGWWMEHQ